MAKLNASKTAVAKIKLETEKTTNYHGTVAYTLSPQQRLVERVLGSFWNENLFYAKGKKISGEIVKNIQEVAALEPKFVLQLANFARNNLYLRTSPQVLLVEAATIKECKQYIREYTPKIVRRADELSDVVAYYVATRGSKKNFPNSLKDGLAKAFDNFDEYQLNKYDSDKASVSLGDVVKLVHPFGELPQARAKALYNYLTKDEVDAENLPKIAALKTLLAKDQLDEEALALAKTSGATWETLTSKFGSSKEVWELAIPNMGYMALLRNLRNFIQKDVSIDGVLDIIKDEKRVKSSKQLPFRFFSAYRELEGNTKVQRAIAQAFENSISNVTLEGKTAILVDLSGSMSSPLSEKSKVSYVDVATVMGAIATKKSDESVVIGFGSTAQRATGINPDDTMMTNKEKIANLPVGHATNAWAAFEILNNDKFNVDRVILFSDMQCYGGTNWGGYNSLQNEWQEYLSKINKNARLYSVDLSAYGTSQFSSQDHNVTLLNGWSDKILDLINLTEKKDVMINEVRKY